MYETKDGIKLNLGCGNSWETTYKTHGFVGLDIFDFGQQHVANVLNGLPYDDNSVSQIRASHFLEHFLVDDAIKILNECHRVLKPGGSMHVIVPSAWNRKSLD